eukprot:TRINITY_DN19630_c0_g1_i1.p1 TRINITY_DN19630_c0_g1~~TRINITY_DN19630_c0_g1_i1.p1  ORF type:complete len:537 (+),score=66.55 TRINITY_DN19630_c0_g1_i1:76-1611(+)
MRGDANALTESSETLVSSKDIPRGLSRHSQFAGESGQLNASSSSEVQPPPPDPHGSDADAYMAWVALGGDPDCSGCIRSAQVNALSGLELHSQAPTASDDGELSWVEFATMMRGGTIAGLGVTADDIAGRVSTSGPRRWTAEPRRVRSTSRHWFRTEREKHTKGHRKRPQRRDDAGQDRGHGESPASAAGRRPVDMTMERLRVQAMRGKGRRRHIHTDENLSAAARVQQSIAHARSHEELMRMFSPEVRLALSAASARRAIGGPLGAEGDACSSSDRAEESKQRLWRGPSPIGCAGRGTAASLRCFAVPESSELRDVVLPYKGISASPYHVQHSPTPGWTPNTRGSARAGPLYSPPVSPKAAESRDPCCRPLPETPEESASSGSPRFPRSRDPYTEVRRFLVRRAAQLQAERDADDVYIPDFTEVVRATLGVGPAAGRGSPVPRQLRWRPPWVGSVGGIRSGGARARGPTLPLRAGLRPPGPRIASELSGAVRGELCEPLTLTGVPPLFRY